jgi:ankyrin repeat protein
MKHLLLTTIATVLLVGCGESQPTEPPTAKAPDINIHKAAQVGNIEAVKQHLAAGTDVNAMDKYGRTTLHAAAVGGSKEVVELLIAKGADVNAKYEECATSLDWAKNQETADLLRKHDSKTYLELEAEGK